MGLFLMRQAIFPARAGMTGIVHGQERLCYVHCVPAVPALSVRGTGAGISLVAAEILSRDHVGRLFVPDDFH